MIARSRVARIVALVCGCLAAVLAESRAGGDFDPTNKYAWTENTGWVNFGPSGGGATVRPNGTNGYLTGYVWGENVGWIKLGDNTGGPYRNNSSTDWGVNLSGSNLSGYAWGENIGWIKFNPTYGGVSVDTNTGRFGGYAWGENIGWIRFYGAAPSFSVRTLAFGTNSSYGTPSWWLTHYGVMEDADEGDGVPAWQEYIADTDPTNPQSYFRVCSMTNLSAMKIYFQSSTGRYYTLQQRASMITGTWMDAANQIGIRGNGGVYFLQDTNVISRRFYRLRAKTTP